MPTREDIEELKSQWRTDPCWPIEEAEGFEEHREELAAFAEAQEADWAAQRLARLDAIAARLGTPGNRDLAEYVDSLEYRIDRLEGIINP